MTPQVLMYMTRACPFCQRAERLLAAKGLTDVARIHVDREPGKRAEMMQKTGRRTVPQIYVGDVYIGGFEELAALDHAGRLEGLLRGEAA
jgi:glutaredoxin 3